jgi:3-oxoacyl-[acyl-carrier-protein] synthase-1
MKEPLAILRVGMFCPVGLDAEQATASIAAGMPRKQETSFRSNQGDRIVMGHLPEDVLPPLAPELAAASTKPTSLVARLLRIATPALQEVLGGPYGASSGEAPASASRGLPHGLAGGPPLFVAGPEPEPGEPALVTGVLLGQLARQARVPLALEASRLFPSGRAGFFAALQEANGKLLAPGAAEFVVVGGVDSYFDADRLSRLEHEQRLLTTGVQDAFTPGEGAAFLLLASRAACVRHRLEPLAWILAVGTAEEPGHRYSERVHRGDGLSATFEQVFRAIGERAGIVRVVMAGLTGESFHAKEWGVACVRHRKAFADPLRVEHPAEYTGDAGAALAPMMLGMTALELKGKRLEGPVLVWTASDGAERGAVLVSAA